MHRETFIMKQKLLQKDKHKGVQKLFTVVGQVFSSEYITQKKSLLSSSLIFYVADIVRNKLEYYLYYTPHSSNGIKD